MSRRTGPAVITPVAVLGVAAANWLARGRGSADAATGQPCLGGASYSRVQPRPDETFRYGPAT